MTNPLIAITTLTASLLDPAGRFAIVNGCSGINSLKALLALAIILAVINRNPPARACLLTLAAILLSIIFNQLRVASLILLGSLSPAHWHTAHTVLGYLFVLPSFYILFRLSERFSK
jgi:exosortase/archaeosortase family protein